METPAKENGSVDVNDVRKATKMSKQRDGIEVNVFTETHKQPNQINSDVNS